MFADGRVGVRGRAERRRAVLRGRGQGLLRSACRCSRPASTARRTSTSTGRRAQGKPFHYFAYGAAVSEVEVDGFTGQYRLLRTDILHDVGDSLSPLVDRGQVEGGFVQGVGWLTTEELVWGGDGALRRRTAPRPTSCRRSASARPICASRSSSAPREPGVVHGSKAVGEPPLMLAISVREALRAAVAAFGAGGIVELAIAGDAGSGVLGHRAGPCSHDAAAARQVLSGMNPDCRLVWPKFELGTSDGVTARGR